MKTIELTEGYWALVCDEDYPWLMHWEWRYTRTNPNSHGHAACTAWGAVPMHINLLKHLGLWLPGCRVYHLNGCRVDNRRENLLVCRKGEWAAYRHQHPGLTSLTPGWMEKCPDCQRLAQHGQLGGSLSFFEGGGI